MAKGPPGYDKQIEFRMRFSDIVQRAAADRGRREKPVHERVGPCLTISRQAGSGGGEIAERISRELGWSVLDKELVADLAERLQVSPQRLALMDETSSNWFRDTLLNLMDPGIVLQDCYVSMLGKVILLAGYQGRVVIVGRGAHLILPRPSVLAVRVVASREKRVEAMAAREGLGQRDAAKRVDELDGSRDSFVRRNFRVDPDDPEHFDLIIDAGSFGIGDTSDLIVDALRRRGLAEG